MSLSCDSSESGCANGVLMLESLWDCAVLSLRCPVARLSRGSSECGLNAADDAQRGWLARAGVVEKNVMLLSLLLSRAGQIIDSNE